MQFSTLASALTTADISKIIMARTSLALFSKSKEAFSSILWTFYHIHIKFEII